MMQVRAGRNTPREAHSPGTRELVVVLNPIDGLAGLSHRASIAGDGIPVGGFSVAIPAALAAELQVPVSIALRGAIAVSLQTTNGTRLQPRLREWLRLG
jgi:hypothetical protein